METNSTCPFCNSPIPENSFFCPSCGKKLNEKPLSTSILKQALMYIVSFFFAPFGLAWAYKYLKQNSPVEKRIGIVIIIITLIATVITIRLASSLYTSLYSSLYEITGVTGLY